MESIAGITLIMIAQLNTGASPRAAVVEEKRRESVSRCWRLFRPSRVLTLPTSSLLAPFTGKIGKKLPFGAVDCRNLLSDRHTLPSLRSQLSDARALSRVRI